MYYKFCTLIITNFSSPIVLWGFQDFALHHHSAIPWLYGIRCIRAASVWIFGNLLSSFQDHRHYQAHRERDSSWEIKCFTYIQSNEWWVAFGEWWYLMLNKMNILIDEFMSIKSFPNKVFTFYSYKHIHTIHITMRVWVLKVFILLLQITLKLNNLLQMTLEKGVFICQIFVT